MGAERASCLPEGAPGPPSSASQSSSFSPYTRSPRGLEGSSILLQPWERGRWATRTAKKHEGCPGCASRASSISAPVCSSHTPALPAAPGIPFPAQLQWPQLSHASSAHGGSWACPSALAGRASSPQHTQPCTKPYLRPCSSHSPTPAETRRVQPRAASPAQSCSLSQALPNALPHPGSLHRGGSEPSPPPETGRRAKGAVGRTWSHSSALQEGIGHKQDSKHAPLSAPFPAGDTQLLTSSSRS